MDDDFNPEEVRPVPYRPDTELTLGPWQLGGLFFVLILLCGLCFLVGYSLGRRGLHNSPATGQRQGAEVSPLGAGSGSKPSAGPQASSRARSAVDGQSRSDGAGAAPVPDSMASGSPAPTATAAASTLALMVQIAAVSHQEDADVLVGALRKRGYAVNVRRDPADNLVHVRVGPFTDRGDANATRQKLLNDGYNAIVQP
jgi:cell division septation protein DedD